MAVCEVQARLKAGYYFDFVSHPFAHAALFDIARPVHEALQSLPAYLSNFFQRLEPPPQPPDRDESGHFVRLPPSHPPGRLLACVPFGLSPIGAEHLRVYLESREPLEVAKVYDRGTTLILEPYTDQSQTAEERREPRGQKPTAIQLSGLTCRPGGRLWVGQGARLVGCHIDLSQGVEQFSIFVGMGSQPYECGRDR
jgi:hypothetical protein